METRDTRNPCSICGAVTGEPCEDVQGQFSITITHPDGIKLEDFERVVREALEARLPYHYETEVSVKMRSGAAYIPKSRA